MTIVSNTKRRMTYATLPTLKRRKTYLTLNTSKLVFTTEHELQQFESVFGESATFGSRCKWPTLSDGDQNLRKLDILNVVFGDQSNDVSEACRIELELDSWSRLDIAIYYKRLHAEKSASGDWSLPHPRLHAYLLCETVRTLAARQEEMEAAGEAEDTPSVIEDVDRYLKIGSYFDINDAESGRSKTFRIASIEADGTISAFCRKDNVTREFTDKMAVAVLVAKKIGDVE